MEIKTVHPTKSLSNFPINQNNTIETSQNRTRNVLSCDAIFSRLN